MATKHKRSSNIDLYSSDNDDSYSTYSEDFENPSRSPTPNNKHRYGSGNKRHLKRDVDNDLLSSEVSSTSFTSTHRSAKKSTQSELRRRTFNKSTGLGVKSSWRSTYSKESRRKLPPQKLDHVQARMFSAQRNRINVLNNELSEAKIKLDQTMKENRLLKTLQQRQDKALRKFEDKEGDLPRLISQHMDEERILKARLRKTQDTERQLETKLRENNEEMHKMENTLRRLKKIVYDKNLGERSELAKQLDATEDKLNESERRNKELEKRLELTTQSFARQINGERSKHKETKEKLEMLRNDFNIVQNKLKEKERALEVSNIYALRSKQTPEKSFVGGKVVVASPRRTVEKPTPVNSEPSPLPISNTPPAVTRLDFTETEKPPKVKERPSQSILDVTNSVVDPRKTIKSPTKAYQEDREDSVLLDLGNPGKHQETNTVESSELRLQNKELDKKGSEENKANRSVFLTANFDSRASSFVSDPPSPTRRHSPPVNIGRQSPDRPRDNFSLSMERRQTENELEREKMQAEEEQRKKAALLAKMKKLEDDSGSAAPMSGQKSDGNDILKLLSNDTKTNYRSLSKQPRVENENNPKESFEQKLLEKLGEGTSYKFSPRDLESSGSRSDSRRKSSKSYQFPREVENLHLGLPSTKANANKTEPELTFGGYAPTVTSPPKRLPRTQPKKIIQTSPPDSESDEPLFDINSGKTKKNNDLLQQLFGEQATKQSSSPAKKENSFGTTRESATIKTTPRAKPIHSGYPWERNVVPVTQQGNGDGYSKQVKKNEIMAAPVVKAVPSFNDDDIEEVIL